MLLRVDISVVFDLRRREAVCWWMKSNRLRQQDLKEIKKKISFFVIIIVFNK